MHWLDLILLLLLGISLIRGFSSGFIKQVIQLVSVVGAFLLASPFSKFLVDLISKHGPTITSSWVGWIISFVALMLLIYLFATFLLSGVEIILGGLNRFLGALLSFLITTIILTVLLGFYSNIGEEYEWTPVPDGLKVYPIIIEISKTILPDQLLIEKDNNDSFEIKAI